MYQYRITKPQPPSSNALFIKPFIIGLVLIGLIIAAFMYKNNLKQKESEDIRAKIEQESKKEQDVEVDFASSNETYKAIDSNTFQLVDIRQPTEYDLKHIESSINIPLSTINQDIHLINQRKIVIIIDRKDSSEGRIFTNHLKNEGLKVKYLEGGIIKYAQDGYALISKGSPASSQDLVKVTSLSAEQIKEKIISGELIAFIDTRTQAIYEEGHIFSAINIPLEELERRKRDLPRRKIVVYDDDPLRSFRAAVRLFDMSVFGVYNSLDNYQTLKKSFERQDPQQSETE